MPPAPPPPPGTPAVPPGNRLDLQPSAAQLQDVDKLHRACEVLLKEAQLGLERALLAFKDPSAAAVPFRTRLQAQTAEADRIGRAAPALRAMARQIIDETRRRFDQLVARAVRAHQGRGHVEGRFQGQYNHIVGQQLADLPKHGTQLLRQQVERGVDQVLGQVFPQGKVPGDVRSAMTRELSRWVLSQPVAEDAFLLLQKVIVDVAGFLHERLTIHGELVQLKERTAQRGQLSPQEAQAADQRAGQLAERAVHLGEQIERRISQSSQVSVQGVLRIDPRLVLDPARRFLDRIDAQAGIKIKADQVTVELGTRLSVTNPLMFNGTTGTQVNPYVNVGANLTPNLSVGASYSNSMNNGQWQGGGEFRASLSWRF